MIKQLVRYAQRAFQLGPLDTMSIVRQRINGRAFDKKWQPIIAKRRANYSFSDLGQKYFDPDLLLADLKNQSFIDEKKLYVDVDAAFGRADEAVKKSFNMLGGCIEFAHDIDWHIDFRLHNYDPKADCTFDAISYFKNISYPTPQPNKFIKDLKVPWELSRLQHLFDLGTAYTQSNSAKYAQAAEEQFLSWYDANPFLCGINWLCPMEVGIRAVNLVWAFHLFKDTWSDELLKKLAASVYDHMIYLENNWELYDGITSNHYLSDLIGYLYCCYFFQELPGIDKKFNWCFEELMREFDKQVFEEGTDYEGSTSYHKLVTEIMYHAFLLADDCNVSFGAQNISKLHRMFMFLDRCITDNGTLLQIGDTDSGKLVAGISLELVAAMKKGGADLVMHYPRFGLSIYKDTKWHITLRHHAYQKPQPAGHYHADIGSITISYKGIPIIVDPGSFVYTAHAGWRNQLRAVSAHSTFYQKDNPPIIIDDALFSLDLPENTFSPNGLSTSHDLYEGVHAHREVIIRESVHINDCWIASTGIIPTVWHFIVHPDVEVCATDDTISLQVGDTQFNLCSSLLPHIEKAWYAPEYGIKKQTVKITYQAPLSDGESISFEFKEK